MAKSKLETLFAAETDESEKQLSIQPSQSKIKRKRFLVCCEPKTQLKCEKLFSVF